MYTQLIAAALLASGVAAQSFSIVTPTSPVECEPLLLNWSGGTGPYFISILPGNQPSAAALLNFGQQSGTSLTWTVNFTSGTSLGLTARDSNGLTAQSAAFTVQPGSDSCLSSSASSGASSTSASSGTSSTSSSGSSSGSSTVVATSTSVSVTGTTSTSVAGSTTGQTSAASTTGTNTATSATNSATHTSGASKGQVVTYGAAAAAGAAILAALA